MVKVKRERLEDDCKVSVDRISVLPHEVLGFILSFLTTKEVIATSILSRRWKYLWTLTPKLDLDGTASLRKLKKSRYEVDSLLHKERCKYIRWVDRLIMNLKSSTNLEEFRVLFDLSQSETVWIDDWLSYAVSRKVERLELNLSAVCYDEDRACYNFPYKRGNFPNNLKVLKKISMHLVNVSGEAVGFLLGNCPLLEQVSGSESKVLSSLEIIRTFPSFKCLEINWCKNLNSVVVRDCGVVCIKYAGMRIQNFLLINVPLLTQLWIQAPLPNRIKGVVDMFESVLPQLRMLKIYVEWRLSWMESTQIISGVEMCNLEQLVVFLGTGYNDKDPLLPVINLISVSPCLQRFVVEASHQHSKGENLLSNDDRDARVYFHGGREIDRRIIPRAYFHLKEMEFVGYRGVINHFDMIMELVENGVALESIVVDPRSFKFHMHRPWDRVPRHKIKDR